MGTHIRRTMNQAWAALEQRYLGSLRVHPTSPWERPAGQRLQQLIDEEGEEPHAAAIERMEAREQRWRDRAEEVSQLTNQHMLDLAGWVIQGERAFPSMPPPDLGDIDDDEPPDPQAWSWYDFISYCWREQRMPARTPHNFSFMLGPDEAEWECTVCGLPPDRHPLSRHGPNQVEDPYTIVWDTDIMDQNLPDNEVGAYRIARLPASYPADRFDPDDDPATYPANPAFDDPYAEGDIWPSD